MDTLKFLKSIEKKLTINPVIYDNKAFIFFKNDYIVVTTKNLANGKYGLIKGEFILIEKDEPIEINKYLEKFDTSDKISEITIDEEVASKIFLASKYAGIDELRPIMFNVVIDNKNIVCTDAHTMYKSDHKIDIKEKLTLDNSFLIPYYYAKFFNGGELLTLNKNNTIIHSNDIKIVNTINSRYPNYDAVIPLCNTYFNCATFTKQKVKELLEITKNLNPVTYAIEINEDNLIIQNKGDFELPNHEEKIKYDKHEINDFEFDYLLMPLDCENGNKGINAKFLNSIALNYDSVKIYFNGNKNRAMLIKGIKSSNKTIKKVTPVKNNDTNKLISELTKQNELLVAQLNDLKKQLQKPVEIEKLSLPVQAITVEEAKTETKIINGPEIIVVDYSDKALALFGDATKNHKEYIKDVLKGRFNPYLKNNDGEKQAGWIISKKYSEKLNILSCKFI